MRYETKNYLKECKPEEKIKLPRENIIHELLMLRSAQIKEEEEVRNGKRNRK